MVRVEGLEAALAEPVEGLETGLVESVEGLEAGLVVRVEGPEAALAEPVERHEAALGGDKVWSAIRVEEGGEGLDHHRGEEGERMLVGEG